MKKIICTYENYDKAESLFESMYFKADDYTPTDKELDNLILPDLEEYILFLLWIDLTGVETEENKAIRKRIHTILQWNLQLVEDVEESEE